MTWRRVGVLLKSLPPTSLLLAELQERQEGALKPTADQIRERQEFHRRREAQHG